MQQPLLPPSPSPTCLSGAAPGADHLWGLTALSTSHALIHFTFPSHRSPCSPQHCILLSDDQLRLAVPAVTLAAATLGKAHVPSRPQAWRLVHRNWWVVRWAGSCYGVTGMPEDIDVGENKDKDKNKGDDGKKDGDGDGDRDGTTHKIGGTAWAMTMFAHLNAAGGQRRMWVFCQERERWLRWGGDYEGRVWEACEEGEVPRPEGVWAGIGSRVLTEGGRRAVRGVLGVDVEEGEGKGDGEGDGGGEEGGEGGGEEEKKGKAGREREEKLEKGMKSRRKENRKARVAEREAERKGRSSTAPGAEGIFHGEGSLLFQGGGAS